MKILIVGQTHGTHLGGSFQRAAIELGHEATVVDAASAFAGPAFLRHISWRTRRRPPRLRRFSRAVQRAADEFRPDLVLVTGSGPIDIHAVRGVKPARIVAFLTDDPWNAAHKSDWWLEALPHYSTIYTPRTANIDDLKKLGCADVRYLPFGYDPLHFHSEPAREPVFDVSLVGGADADRVRLIVPAIKSGYSVGLFGAYWDRFAETRAIARGIATPAEVRAIVSESRVNLCPVRRSNRDGHVMRSFELAAIGACILAEETAEHRAIFGEDLENVAYYSNDDIAAPLGRLLANDSLRQRLLANARLRVLQGQHTYADRLRTIIDAE